ncbi:helix-turn-helix domain-containing protein [Mesobacillus campisalis]|uniref:helix-turn-helix domain-containing protein n=1 Tax=Mesobacillus campisalis TaxID=1408103 RepID=UPI000B0544BA|nr:helix-turn-helix transcriptional regulator [Mesobacillus campisalis]
MIERLPYNQELDYRMIRLLRHSRNLTLKQMATEMNIDPATLSRIETGQMQFTNYYESKLRDAIKRLRITNVEIASIRKIIEVKAIRGIK